MSGRIEQKNRERVEKEFMEMDNSEVIVGAGWAEVGEGIEG